VEVDVVTPSAEFPNDNPALHRGVSWICAAVTGPPSPERVPVVALAVDVAVEVEVEDEVAAAPALEVEAAVADHAALEEAALPVATGAAGADLSVRFEIEGVQGQEEGPLAEPPPPRASGIVPIAALDLDEDDDEEPIVVAELDPIDEVALEGAVAKSPPAPKAPFAAAASAPATALPPPPDDPFTVLVCTLSDVALGEGAPHVAALLPALLH
jgi:hypothetical protein